MVKGCCLRVFWVYMGVGLGPIRGKEVIWIKSIR